MTDEEWAPPAPTPPGAAGDTSSPVVPGYSDLVVVARGGDSVVYRARQDSLGRDVAIKVVRPDDPSAADRFRRELEITVRLGRQHPHIVTVLDTTTTAAGEPCLVMDFHDLGSLHDRLTAQGPLSPSEVVEAGTAVADALAFAHAAGVLHRDVKPQNILVLPTSYVLSDFGIARRADAGRTASLERFSYRHASPQVLDGLTPTAADDVWSLGSTLFTLLDGRAPFASDDPDDDTALAYLRRVRLNERRRLHRTDLPAGLADVVEQCLAPDRAERIASAERVLGMLRGIRTEGRSWEPDAAGTGRAGEGGGDGRESSSASGLYGPPRAAHAEGSAPGPHRFAAPAESDASAGLPEPGLPEAARDAASTPGAATPGPATPVTPHVSRSALADLDPAPATTRGASADDEPTGTLAAPDAEPAAVRGPTRGRGWRRVAFFLGGMLLAGAAIGIVTALVQGHGAPAPSTTAGAATSVPSAPAPTGGTGPAQAAVSNPDFAPRDLVVTGRGTSALLTWAAPTHGVTSIAVIRIEAGKKPVLVANLAPSATGYTVEGLDPDAESCFAVAGYGTQDGTVVAGSTPQACTG